MIEAWVRLWMYPLWALSASGAFYWWAVQEGLGVLTLRTPPIADSFPTPDPLDFVTSETAVAG